MQTQIAAVEAQFAALNAQMQKAAVTPGIANPQAYANTARQVDNMSKAYSNAVSSTGMFDVSQHRTISSSQKMTEMLQKQKVGLRDVARNMGTLKTAYREQLALQRASITSWGTDQQGRIMSTMAVPKQVPKGLDTIGRKMGFIREVTRSVAQETINWGKNTQWAGRQLMVGFTMPVAAFGAVAGALAYSADKELTRIEKVYDTKATTMQGKEAEWAKLREASLKNASKAASMYGVAMEDTLKVEADLAATGLRGNKLMESTNLVMRTATLGEMDHADALQSVISMQSIFKDSTADVSKNLAYMNAIENATSLSAEDFAKAIPIALNPLKEMTPEVASSTEVMQNLGLMLVAMKERGIQANQGANAIKSMMQRLYRPSKQLKKEWMDIANINLDKLVKSKGGDIMKILPAISEAVKDMGNADRIKLLGGLFGTYQVTRLNAILEGLGAMNDKMGQTAAVLRVNEAGMKSWTETMNQELDRQAKSASGKILRSFQTLKVELARMGTPFLELGTIVLKGLTGIAKWFNGLSDTTKKIAAGAAILTALAGPAIMLAGLFGNLLGHAMKLGVSIMGLGGKMKLYTKDGWAAKKVADLQTQGFISEAKAVSLLTAELSALNSALARTMGLGAKPIAGGVITGAGGRHAAGTAPVIVGGAGGAYSAQQRPGAHRATSAPGMMPLIIPNDTMSKIRDLDDKTAKVSDNAKKTGKMFKGWGGPILAATSALSLLAFTSEGTAQQIGEVALYAAMIGPALAMIPWGKMASKVAEWAGSMSKFATTAMTTAKTGGLAGIWTNLKGILGTGLRVAGPAGVLASIGVGLGVIAAKADDAAESMGSVNQSGNKIAEFMGFEYKVPKATVGPDNKEVETTITLLEKYRKAFPELTAEMKRLKDMAGGTQHAINGAIKIGLETVRSGGSLPQALEMVRLSLLAAGFDEKTVQKMMITIKPMFKTDKAVLQTQLQQVKKDVITAAKDALPRSIGDEIIYNVSLKPGDEAGIDTHELSSASTQAAQDSAVAFYETWRTVSGAKRKSLMRDMGAQFQDMRNELMKPLIDNFESRDLMKRMGVSSMDEFMKLQPQQREAIRRAAGMTAEELQTIAEKYRNIGVAQNVWVREFGKAAGLTEEEVKGLKSMEDLLVATGQIQLQKNKAQEAYAASLSSAYAAAALSGTKVTDGQKLQLLNMYRQMAGLQKTRELLDGFGPATKKWEEGQKGASDETKRTGDEAKKAEEAVKGVNDELSKAQKRRNAAWEGTDVRGALRGAYEQTQQDFADRMTERFEAQADRRMERVEEQGERRMEAYETRVEAREAEFDRAQERMEIRHENQTARLEARQERQTFIFERDQERELAAFEADQEAAQAAFDAKQTRLQNQFDDRQTRLQNAFDDKQAQLQQDFEDKQEDEARRFDKRWEDRTERVTKHYDNRIEAINKTIAAEQKAEENRQRIFEAEMTRISRMADAENMNIDFNVALNTGDLDEAAKIRNDIWAQQDAWAYEDVANRSQRRSDRRVDRLESTLARIEKEKDRRIKALEDMEEAHRVRFEKEQRREQRMFEKARLRDQRQFERERLQDQRQFEARKTREQRQFERRMNQEKTLFDRHQELARRQFQNDQAREQTALERSQRRATKRLENEREHYQKIAERRRARLEEDIEETREAEEKKLEMRRKHLEKALEALQRFVPRNERELKQHIKRIGDKYGVFGGQLERWGDKWGNYVGGRLSANIREAGQKIKNDISWASIGRKAASEMIAGAFDMNLRQFKKWVGVDAGIGDGERGNNRTGRRARRAAPPGQGNPDWRPSETAHSGGLIGSGINSRKGYPGSASNFPSEVNVRAKRGEFMVNDKATRQYRPILEAINSGKLPKTNPHRERHQSQTLATGGAGGRSLGLVGLLAMGVQKAMMSKIKQTIFRKADQMMREQSGAGMFKAAKPGMYGGTFFSKSQLKNAAKIATAGKEVGASKRDILTALATAMVESRLVNVRGGHLDSVGLFQQRDAWGPKEVRMDPIASAKMFFKGGRGGQEGLFDIKNRDSRPIGENAQDVQVSRYPGRYAQWVEEARAIFEAMKYIPGFGGDSNGIGREYVRSSGKQYPGVEPVKPWVREAAEYIGALHNVGTIGGWRASSAVANSDHPRGLALDLMVPYPGSKGKRKGDAIADTVKAMWKLMDIKYMIWRQRIKDSKHGRWERMDNRGSPTANHMDHVHLSFTDKGEKSNLLNRDEWRGDGGGRRQGSRGRGGKHRPVRKGTPMTQGTHDGYTGYPAYDLAGNKNDPIYAVRDGRVFNTERRRDSYGNHIQINHTGMSQNSLYAHLARILVREGEYVRAGEKIGKMGSTGKSTGVHVHFGVSGAGGPGNYWPSLDVGGNIRWDNTIANLHKDETVLTAPLSEKLKRGIDNLDSGGGNSYTNVVVNPAPGMDEAALAEKVARVLDRRARRTGRTRNVGVR